MESFSSMTKRYSCDNERIYVRNGQFIPWINLRAGIFGQDYSVILEYGSDILGAHIWVTLKLVNPKQNDWASIHNSQIRLSQSYLPRLLDPKVCKLTNLVTKWLRKYSWLPLSQTPQGPTKSSR